MPALMQTATSALVFAAMDRLDRELASLAPAHPGVWINQAFGGAWSRAWDDLLAIAAQGNPAALRKQIGAFETTTTNYIELFRRSRNQTQLGDLFAELSKTEPRKGGG